MIEDFIKKSKEKRPRIAVIGDAMVDQQFAVKVTRLNPEFPTQCLWSEIDKPIAEIPGGASNLAYQSTHFNVDVFLLSLLDDYSFSVFKDHKFDTSFSVKMKTGRVPSKRRFYDGDFPLQRWDVEKPLYGEPDIEICRNQLFKNFLEIIDDIDIVILSDYDKGVFSESFARSIIIECNDRGLITVVDPKCINLNKWEGCSVFKPNAKYVKDFKFSYEGLKEKVNCRDLIITDSGNGIYISGDRYYNFEELSKRRPVIRSVSGAGDTFALFLSISLVLGFSVKESAKIAYNCSTVYIQDKHNNPITPYHLLSWDNPIRAKIIDINDLVYLRKLSRDTIVFTNGVFDIIHRKHLELFNYAKNLGYKLIVGVNSDESVNRLKGNSRPINKLDDRMAVLSHVENVDFIVPFSEDTPIELIKKLEPNIIVKGGDYRKNEVVGFDVVGEENVFIFPYENGYSTTNLIKSMESNIVVSS